MRLEWINWFFQKILGQNSSAWWSVHYTSRVDNYKDRYRKKGSLFFDGELTYNSFKCSPGCYFNARNGIQLGYNVIFGPGVKVISTNDDRDNLERYTKNRRMIIGAGTWLGANVIILPGVRIGKNCIIAAGTIVNKSFKEHNLLIGGSPAKILKRYL